MGNVMVIGSLNYDVCASVDRIPEIGETILGDSVAYHCGGKGGNQAYACAKAGAETTMLGAVGADACAEILKRSLTEAGVNAEHLLEIADTSSGNAIISVDAAGNNTIIVIPGANARVTEAYVRDMSNQFQAGQVVVLQFEIPQPAVYEAIRLAKEKGCVVVLNPAPARNIDPAYLSAIDYLTPNETELRLLVQAGGSLEEKAAALIDGGVKRLIVTLGEKGVMYMDEGKHTTYYPARKVNAVDTVGAGDCFNGFFCAAIADGKPVSEAIQKAIVASSISVSRSGAQSSFPDGEEVLRVIAAEKNG